MKFFNLLKKELKEMLTIQTIITLAVIVAVLSFAGKGLSNAIEEATEEGSSVTICDKDNTEFSKGIINTLSQNVTKSMPSDVAELNIVELKDNDYSKEFERLDINNVVIIPKGFTDKIKNGETAEFKYISKMTSLTALSNAGNNSDAMLSIMEGVVKSKLYEDKINTGKITANEVAQLDSPVAVDETTVVADKSSDVSSTIVLSLCQMQGMFIPIIVFLLIMYSSQMLLNAISTEKLDKTLETLLSAPISRMSVLSAKMLAAAIVAAIMAIAFMFGMNNMTSVYSTGGDVSQYSNVLNDLGLTLSVGGYALVGLQMFMSVLIGLSLSLVLGALAKDIKSAQALVMPILFTAMIPYLLSMVLDIKTLSPVFKYIVYAIPFTHTFMSSENIMFGNMSLYWGGLIYQVIILAISMTIAVRIFTSDKIFTISFSFGERRKNKKAKTV